MNDENLIPLSKRSQRERKEIARMGAIASNKVQKQRKMMREVVQMLMSDDISDNLVDKLNAKLPFLEKGMDFQTAIVIGQMMSAMDGNSKAFELLTEMNDNGSRKSDEYDPLSKEQLEELLNGTKPSDDKTT